MEVLHEPLSHQRNYYCLSVFLFTSRFLQAGIILKAAN